MPVKDYAERQEERKERLEDRAARLAKEATETLNRARKMADAIPFGQPIMVGHHSEGRDRRYRARIDRTFHKAVETHREAERAAERADSAGSSGAISSDDPQALEKLRAKIAQAEDIQAKMKAANKIVRSKIFTKVEKVLSLEDLLGVTENQALKVLAPSSFGECGFPRYKLTNNNANIRRMKQRLEYLSRVFKQAERAEENGKPEQVEEFGEILVIRNLAENRLQMEFLGKPSQEVRGILKRHGFRWSPKAGRWQRLLNGSAVLNAKWTLEAIEKIKPSGVED